MGIALKPLRKQTIVITGASSGIGLATARAAAREGANLVLVSRNEKDLREITGSINAHGGNAIYAVADVARRPELEAVAELAIAEFGGFDTWVNNAGVGIWGKLEDVSDEDSRRLFDTNFWGLVNGSLVAVEYLKRKGGALINLGSVASDTAFPLQGMYCASKHAIKGFTDALRVELASDGAPVSVTLIKPAAIATPFAENAGVFTEKAARLPDPLYKPEEVAGAILYAASHGKRDIYVGGGGRMLSSFNWHVPGIMDWMSRKFLIKAQLRNAPARNGAGSLHEAGTGDRIAGFHPGQRAKRSFYTRAVIHPVITGLVLGGVFAAIATAVVHSRPHRKICSSGRGDIWRRGFNRDKDYTPPLYKGSDYAKSA